MEQLRMFERLSCQLNPNDDGVKQIFKQRRIPPIEYWHGEKREILTPSPLP
jgi:hypothetical protein